LNGVVEKRVFMMRPPGTLSKYYAARGLVDSNCTPAPIDGFQKVSAFRIGQSVGRLLYFPVYF
jgi:hypothetical protein